MREKEEKRRTEDKKRGEEQREKEEVHQRGGEKERRRRRRMLGTVSQRGTIAGNLLFVQYCVQTLLLAGRYITLQTLPLTHCRYRNHRRSRRRRNLVLQSI